MLTQTVTLMGQTATVAIKEDAVDRHMREGGVPRDMAIRAEAHLTFAEQLVELQVKRYGAAAGNALAIKLEAQVMDAIMAAA